MSQIMSNVSAVIIFNRPGVWWGQSLASVVRYKRYHGGEEVGAKRFNYKAEAGINSGKAPPKSHTYFPFPVWVRSLSAEAWL